MRIFSYFKIGRSSWYYSVHRGLVLPLLALFATLLINSATSIQAQQLPRPLYIINSDGTNLRLLAQPKDHECCGSPMWTPDGKQIVFDAFSKQSEFRDSHIYSVNADGSSLTHLTLGAMPSGDPTKPHGLAYHGYGRHSGTWLGVKTPIEVDQSGGSPRWHPTKSKLAVLKWGGAIVAREIDGTKIGKEEILVPADYSPILGFAWSPDGRKIAFHGKQKKEQESDIELFVLDVTVKKSKPAVKATGRLGKVVSWSADGKKIAFDQYSIETSTQQILLVDSSADESAVLLKGQDATRDNVSPAWSPDGKQIVFASRKSPYTKEK